MKNKICLAIALCYLLLPLCSIAKEPPNISITKKQAMAYYQDGEYFDEIITILFSAKKYLQERIETNAHLQKPRKLAIVLDIDETALSNYPHLLAMDFSFIPKQVDETLKLGDAKPFRPIKELFQYAKNNHVAVFFITGRKEVLTSITIKNLHNAGYNQWTGLYLKPNYYTLPTNIPYKQEVRKKITQQGFDIVANIGDQNSDLIGGYSERTFKLPNPFYYIP